MNARPYDGDVIERLVSAALYLALPLAGIVFFDWDWRSVVVLYWLQNITVGLRTVIDMIRTNAPASQSSKMSFTFNGQPMAGGAPKPFLVMFFMVHYGIFTTVHGVFVFLIVNGAFNGLFRLAALQGSAGGWSGVADGAATAAASGSLNLSGIILAWAIGSVVQIVAGFLVPRDTLPPAQKLFFSPYTRIFVLHFTVLAGVGLITYLNWPPAAAVLLVALQFIVDLWKPPARYGQRVAVAS